MHRQHFDGDALSVGAARDFVRACLAEAANIEAIVLLVSELATNAVIHAGTSFEVTVVTLGDRIRVTVADSSPDLPARRFAQDTDTGGRGLHLVDALADDWGVERRDDGKETWFKVWA
ncbi:MAG: ATP-binding protein [Actinomycetota bacterium]|nr:ATP-binding protein [Actinomycetota bacterium]